MNNKRELWHYFSLKAIAMELICEKKKKKKKKKKIFWKYSIQSLKTADSVWLSLFMRDNGRRDIPHAA